MTRIGADGALARVYLDQVFGGAANGSPGVLELGKLSIWSAATKQTVWCSSLDEATVALVNASNRGENVYHSVALHNLEIALEEARVNKNDSSIELVHVRGCARSATALLGAWSDEDHGAGNHKKANLPPNAQAVLEYLGRLPAELQLSLLVDSGGGFYPWWVFREPWVLDSDRARAEAAALVAAIQRYLRKVHAPQFANDFTADLARVLRAPGTVNHKYGRLVKIVALGEVRHALR